MGNRATLIPFVKNDPRRINKPKGAISWKTRYMNELEKSDNAQKIISKSVELAAKGDVRHTEIIFERTEGKITQPMENTTKVDLSGIDAEKLDILLEKLKNG